MFKQLTMLVVIAIGSMVAASTADAQVHVGSYFRSNGTYVQSHYRSRPDGNFYNNWSTYPNVNPYTGRTGTRHMPSYRGYYRLRW